MKNILFLILCFSILQIANAAPLSAHNSELDWVNKQVEAIIPSRHGVSDSYINGLKEPFEFTYVTTTAKGNKTVRTHFKRTKRYIPPLRVTLIINSKALINGRWYKLNDSIRGYKIVAINALSVKLKRRGWVKMLYIQEKNKHVKIHMK